MFIHIWEKRISCKAPQKDWLAQEILDYSTALYKPCLKTRVNKNCQEIISLLNKVFAFLPSLRPLLRMKKMLNFNKVWLKPRMKGYVEKQKKVNTFA